MCRPYSYSGIKLFFLPIFPLLIVDTATVFSVFQFHIGPIVMHLIYPKRLYFRTYRYSISVYFFLIQFLPFIRFTMHIGPLYYNMMIIL